MDATMTHHLDRQTVTAEARRLADGAHDAWKLGALTSAQFSRVTDRATAAIMAAHLGDWEAAERMLGEADEALNA